jgi:soluble lytic murein transglycosylase-like protein
MQVTGEKCPSQDDSCLDPNTNIMIGAQYFARTVDQNGGNLAQAMGMYNGWVPFGTTEYTANNVATCGQRNNLDYLHMVFNGFMQGRNPRDSPAMGTFFNTNC